MYNVALACFDFVTGGHIFEKDPHSVVSRLGIV
jgi:hypothetical protein